MTWKIINISDTGTASKFGGDDGDKVSKLFSGIDVDDVDINADWTFRSGKLYLRNPANTFSYNIVPAAIIANRTLNIPLTSATDTFTLNALSQTLSAKTLDSSCIISSTGSLPSTVVAEDVSNSFDDFDTSFKDNRLRIWNPADTFRTTVVNGAQSADRNLSIPVLSGDDNVVVTDTAQTLKNKTIDHTNVLNPTLALVNPWSGSETAASVKRTGIWIGVSDTQTDGLLAGGLTAVGTGSNFQDATEGHGRSFATGAVANNNAGLRWTVNRFRREWGNYMITRVSFSSTSDIRVFIGWSSSNAEIAGETTLNNFEGVGVGKRTGDTNWFTYRNDGDATEDRVDTGIAFATSAVSIQVALDGTSFKSKIGTTTNTEQTTELPASSTMLYPKVEIETGAGAADKTVNILPIFAKTGPVTEL